jgi:type II secretory pathway component PulJ
MTVSAPARAGVDTSPAGRGTRERAPDGGSTLIEMLLAMGLVALVSAFAGTFHVVSLSTVRTQANRQAAAQLVTQGMDRAHRDGAATVTAAPPAARTTTVNGIVFTERWTVSVCRQVTAGAACTAAIPAAGVSDLVRIEVAVEWRESNALMTERSAVLLAAGGPAPTFVT